MTDADLNQAIRIAGIQHSRATTVAMSNAALDHLETLREAQRRRAQDRGSSALEAQLKDTIDCQDEDLAVLRKELQEAREAAARADKTTEKLHANAREFAELSNERLMKIRKLEQQVQTQGNTIAKRDESISRMNVEIRGMDHQLSKLRREKDAEIAALRIEVEDRETRNDNQRQLIQTLRERSATALAQRIRDDMDKVERHQSSVSFDHLRQILDAYERQGFGDEQ